MYCFKRSKNGAIKQPRTGYNIDMRKFETEYKKLNNEQKRAVDAIDGPLLVVAGPGTGKTQLLSLRVANIIEKTDTAPGNILCLTFTDNAARNMRERLEEIIGHRAYHVNIHTFHSFGSDIIDKYPDHFVTRQLIQQIDELGSYELLREIFESLPHDNPYSVRIGEEYIMLKDVLSAISWFKKNALLPKELHEIVNQNQKFTQSIEKQLANTFATTPTPKNTAAYEKLLKAMARKATGKKVFGFPDYATVCADELQAAISQIDRSSRYAPSMTAWRNRWCEKNAHNEHVLKDGGRSLRKMHALANIYQDLLGLMSQRGLFDFDDMIVEAVHALELDDDLRLTLQERYQYVLVDEFQDTNKAQLRILEALGNNPIFEGKPNIMAVGDDDQAIYAFQGAEVSNMVVFTKLFNDPKVIALQDNYRSSGEIIEGSYSIAQQISDRLSKVLPAAEKRLRPMTNHPKTNMQHNIFGSELSQYSWIAEQIEGAIKTGTKPEDIAVIAPRHKYLERLMPYLGKLRIPVAYERRENILEAPIVLQLLKMSELVVHIQANKHDEIDALLSEVLGFEFWEIPADELTELSLECYNKNKHWMSLAPTHNNTAIAQTTKWFIRISQHSKLEPLEYILDQFMGVQVRESEDEALSSSSKPSYFVSPLKDYYFNEERFEQSTDTYLALLGQLSTLRQSLRRWKPKQTLFVADFVDFAKLHKQAKLKIIDTNPHTQTTSAVQVMTAYKAKGLEFGSVFIINAQDEIWGPTARSRTHRVTLPKNLPIAPLSDSDNDKLRLLFVALTRAKHTLYITSYTHTLENKLSPLLSFIGSPDSSENTHFQAKQLDRPSSTEAVEILATDWVYRLRRIIADKPALFEPILSNYKLSVTHLNNFIDVVHGGPEYFFMHNLLRFPQAPTAPAAYGDAIHETLRWIHGELRKNTKLPSIKQIEVHFLDMLDRKHLTKADYKRFSARGKSALKGYMEKRSDLFDGKNLVERGFNNDGVVIGSARLSGKIDKMSFIEKGVLSVVDFKTGKPAHSWQGKDDWEKIKLHRYRQQLLFYKLLVENSSSYHKNAVVKHAALEFIEPDDNSKLVDDLVLEFEDKELKKFALLIGVVWQKIMNLDFPDISAYPQNYKGVLLFEQDLINVENNDE